MPQFIFVESLPSGICWKEFTFASAWEAAVKAQRRGLVRKADSGPVQTGIRDLTRGSQLQIGSTGLSRQYLFILTKISFSREMNGAVLQLGRATQRLRIEAQRSCSSLVTTSFESDDQVSLKYSQHVQHMSLLTTKLLSLMGKKKTFFTQVAVITLNNPGKLNALTEEMGYQLTATVEELQGKKELRAAILTGDSEIMRQQDWDSYQGAGKAFSAGGDLAWLMERHRDTAENNIRVMQVIHMKEVLIR